MKNDIYQHKQLQECQMRKCIDCGIQKSTGEFPKSGKNKSKMQIYHSVCKTCFCLRGKKIVDRRRLNNLCLVCGDMAIKDKKYCEKCRDRDIKRIVRRRIDLKKKAIEYKERKCEDCGIESEHYAIYDFHHSDPNTKEDNINNIMNKKPKWATIKKELDKCILLCSNCHRIRHEKKDNV